MITVLSGGTGTPKFLQGIKELVDPEDINVIVNTVENNYFSGLYVAGDIDTVMYTLADMINESQWYGIEGDTYITNERLADMGFPELLRIGDMDRANKIQKTLLLKEGYSLSEIVRIQCEYLSIDSTVVPMSDEDSDISILTDKGELSFHDFLIKEGMEPDVLDVVFSNVSPAPGVIDLINKSDIVIIGPSNPITSILPILKMDGVVDALKDAYVVSVSPMIGDGAVSGPGGKFMNALGYQSTALGVSEMYKSFLNKMIIDLEDSNLEDSVREIVDEVVVCNTFMKTLSDKKNLAENVLSGKILKK